MANTSGWNLRRAGDADKVFLIRTLNMILEQEGNFLATYDVVLRKITDADARRDVEGFREDHARRVNELIGAVEALGGEAFDPRGPSPEGRLEDEWTRSATDAESLLALFEISERQGVWLYDAARSAPGLSPEANAILERAHQEEQRHHAWATARVGSHAPGTATAARR